jgi:dienelactone hydrolase
MKTALLLAIAATASLAQNTKDVTFYSEDVHCHARLFLPKDFSATGKSPAVVLAPGWGETATSIEKYAALFAAQGLVAMTIDYRGWGKSGGYIYLLDNLRYDDRLRFSQHTAKVRIRRKRLLPSDQILDIRNAISYLQGEPGVDRTRIGVWGTDMAGGHAIGFAFAFARGAQEVVDKHLRMDFFLDIERWNVNNQITPVLLVLPAPSPRSESRF